MDGRVRLARVIAAAALVLFAANGCYGLAHEAAHAVVIEALGGQVYGIYVNLFGTDAYTGHTAITDPAGLIAVNAAGLCATTLLAAVLGLAGQGLPAAFLAARTAIYALNYAPGTDAATLHATIGGASLALSLAIAAVNLGCVCYALPVKKVLRRVAEKRLTAGLSSS